jgi:thiopeptide-type bacteriocin biosynthesis protein
MNYIFNNNLIIRTPSKPFKISFTKNELTKLFTLKEVKEALFLSSPNLLNEFNKWQNGDLTNEVEEEKLINSLLKYAMRMHSRSTPFGLFAGCNVINFKNENYKINTAKAVRNTRLDMHFTCTLSQELAKLPFIQPHLKFQPNYSIYHIQDKIRYVDYYYKNKSRTHQISAVDSSIYLQTILQQAKNGATLNELAESIVDEEVTKEDALSFIQEIISVQILVNELEPAVTGNELLSQILKVLFQIQKKHPNQALHKIIRLLKSTQNKLLQIDTKVNNNISVYKTVAENLKQLNIPFELNKLFQTDLYISISSDTSCTVNKKEEKDTLYFKTQDQLTKTIKILNRLTEKPNKTNLTEFQKRFYERYENKEISLLEALDTETGIGYAQNNNYTGDMSPLVNTLILPFSNKQEVELKWTKKQSFLFKKLLEAQQNKHYSITINLKDVSQFEENWNDLPDTFSVMFKHVGKQKKRNLLCLQDIGGASATCLLGRFASNNKSLEKIVTEIAEVEKQLNPNAILAEIVHLPKRRIGNVLLRPAFRDYEIPYLSNSSLSKEKQITLGDLYLSIKKNQLFLRSKRLTKQVLPYLGNAHNYSANALPVYQFLCDIQTQDLRKGLFFSWGSLSKEFSFLPRVEIGNVIVSSATWQFNEKEYHMLLADNIELVREAKIWQEKWLLPNLILLVEGDNELLINLKDKLSLRMFISIIKKRLMIIVKEFLFDEKTAIVRNEKGNAYTNEFIAILQKKPDLPLRTAEQIVKQAQTQEQIPRQAENDNIVARTFSLGSEWLYYKLYCGVKTADTILTEVIKPLTELFIQQQLIDHWFFIRYADPDIHLRVRFHFTNLKHIGTVVDLFQKAIAAYEKNGLIWKVQTDTYQREIERYGENTILLGEHIFYYDSKCIVDMLDLIDGDEGEEIRWLFAIKMIDTLLVNFNYSEEQKRDLLEDLKTGFAIEFNMNKDLKIQLDKRFRTHRKSIVDILDIKNDHASELQPLYEILNEKSIRIKPIANQILALHQNKQLPLSLNNLLASYIHMLLNRLFKNKQRLHEMVVYDLMWRTYRSELAKQKSINKKLVN